MPSDAITAEDVLGYEPTRERAVELLGALGLHSGVLLFGFALGATWVGSSVSMAGCTTLTNLTGPCSVLGGVQQWTQWFALASVAAFLIAFGAEHYGRRFEDSEGEGQDSRTDIISDQEVTTNQ